MSKGFQYVLALVLAVGAGVAAWLIFFKPGPPIPPPAQQPLFQESAAQSGLNFRMQFLPEEQGEKFKINLYDHGAGVAVGDYDGDGRDDIYFLNQLGANALYRNQGDGTFKDVTDQAGVGLGDRICVAAVFADYDGDGRQDLYVTSVRGGNVLFHNEGDGKFKDVTKTAGVGHIGHSQSGHFFDHDQDGDLDLLLTCTAQWTHAPGNLKLRYYLGKSTLVETATSPREFNVFYRNNGDGTFTDVTDAVGLKGLGWAGDAAIFDYDGDGLLDVAITNMFGRAQLYRNQGKGTFEDVTLKVLGKTSFGGMGIYPWDFNNDGLLDLFMVDMHSDMWPDTTADLATVEETTRYPYLSGPAGDSKAAQEKSKEKEKFVADLLKVRYDEVVFGNALYKNLGGGKFAEVSEKANLETFWPWGIACGDFDNNGFEDVFIPAGMGYPYAYWPNSLMMNDGKESFSNRARPLGVEPPPQGMHSKELIGGKKAARSSRAAAVADFDGDGRLDIVVNNFNDAPYFFRNKGKGGNYLALRLQGTKSNRDAIGAVVRVHVGKEILTRQVNTAGGYLAQSSRVLHFGLGERSKIDKIDITWPSGLRQELTPPALNALHTVVEPAK